MHHVNDKILERFMVEVFTRVGVPPDEAAICADVLIESDRRGIDSHGINRCKPIYYDRIKAGILNVRTQFEIVRETPTTAVVDGHNGMGKVIAKRCMQMAIDKARACGLGMVVTRHSTHYGIAGYYATMATAAGMIGMTGTNARPSIPPTFSVEAMMGTNPLTFGIPTDEAFPFVLDCATSIIQRGTIEYYERLGMPTPAGLVIDNAGQIRTDSVGILEALQKGNAALLPIGGAGEETGGHKGYGYCTVVEILSSALQAGNFMKALTGMSDGKRTPIELGHFFLAINVENFIDLPSFKKNTGDLLRDLRAARLAPGATRIYTAGEKEHEAWVERQRTGIPMPKPIQDDIDAMRRELGITGFHFPWDA